MQLLLTAFYFEVTQLLVVWIVLKVHSTGEHKRQPEESSSYINRKIVRKLNLILWPVSNNKVSVKFL